MLKTVRDRLLSLRVAGMATGACASPLSWRAPQRDVAHTAMLSTWQQRRRPPFFSPGPGFTCHLACCRRTANPRECCTPVPLQLDPPP